ncbi:DUF2029 domain-containing protein, partial [bacterium]|nr:DUF2029 domain-containing protein [bacterium]
MLLVSGVLNLIASYFISCVINNFLGIYIAFFAFVVLNIEILSLFRAINDINILIFSFLNHVFSFLFFKYKKANFLKADIDFSKIKNAFLLDKSLILLTGAWFILILVSGFLAYVMPPLEPDSQTYHFIRAYYYAKNQSLAHFDTNDIRALIMPFNSEIIYTYIFSLKHKFYNFALLSYFSYFAIITALWQILSYLKYSIRKKLYTIFLLSSLASIVVEMSCLQTDIVAGALFISAFALFLKKKNFISALSIALALGVKTTAIIMIIPYLIALFLLNKKDFWRYLGFIALNFIIFSSYNYILNFIQFQNPVTNHSAYLGHKFWGGFSGYISNLIHFTFQFFDFTGFSWGYYLNYKIFAIKDFIFEALNLNPDIGNNVAHSAINITTDEQITGFGVLGLLALIPSIIKGFYSKSKILFLLSLCFILNILILARFMAYMEYSIRFIAAFAILSASTLVLIYRKKGIYKNILTAFCIFYMAVIPIHIRRAPFYKIYP